MERLIVLGLGSNLGDKAMFLDNACTAIASVFRTELVKSSIYETAPVGFESATQFLNQCISFRTACDASYILNALQEIESKLGRVRPNKTQARYSSRTIDIDILFIGDEIHNSERLIVPHPRLHERKFVLFPLAEIAPEFVHPVSNIRVLDLLDNVEDDSFVKKK